MSFSAEIHALHISSLFIPGWLFFPIRTNSQQFCIASDFPSHITAIVSTFLFLRKNRYQHNLIDDELPSCMQLWRQMLFFLSYPQYSFTHAHSHSILCQSIETSSTSIQPSYEILSIMIMVKIIESVFRHEGLHHQARCSSKQTSWQSYCLNGVPMILYQLNRVSEAEVY